MCRPLTVYEHNVINRLGPTRSRLADFLKRDWVEYQDASSSEHPPAFYYIFNVLQLAFICVTIYYLYIGDYAQDGQLTRNIPARDMMGDWLSLALIIIELPLFLISLGLLSVAKQSVHPRWIERAVLGSRPRSARIFDGLILLAKIALCGMLIYAEITLYGLLVITYFMFVIINNIAYVSLYKMEIREAVHDIETTGEIGRSTFMDDFPAPGGH